MSSLKEQLGTGEKRQQVIEDAIKVLDAEVADKGGLTGLAVKGGYKVVQVVGKTPTEPKKEYVDMVLKEMGGGLEEARPMSSVIKTIGGN